MILWGHHLFCLFYAALSASADPILSGAHFLLARRGGQLSVTEIVNLTRLNEIVEEKEEKYQTLSRTIKDNRPARISTGIGNEGHPTRQLVADIGRFGSWFAILKVGDPAQDLEFDLDMLHPDFFLVSTTGITTAGSKYNSFASKSHAGSENRVHPECRLPTDLLYLSNMTIATSVSLQIPMCGPPKYSRRTLGPSGNVMGLAPSNALAQTAHTSLLDLLSGVIVEEIWSITLLDSQSGILSLGTTIAPHFEEAKVRTQIELHNLGQQGVDTAFIDKETQLVLEKIRPKEWRNYFRWSDVRGAAGWWTSLLQGVWINGVKILKNQPVLFDIQVPFILAPPPAAKRFYASISGSKRLPKPHDRFFAFPCMNQPSIAFEFDAWLFPTMGGEKSRTAGFDGLSGGKFSLGKEKLGSGYCVGVVVETSMGLKQSRDQHDVRGSKQKNTAGNGLGDFWVIGEPFFRGTGLVFDVREQKIGFRSF